VATPARALVDDDQVIGHLAENVERCVKLLAAQCFDALCWDQCLLEGKNVMSARRWAYR